MKKTLSLLLSILMLLPLLYSCGDKENPASDFEYEENEDGGITITNYIGTDADVVIPSTIDGKNVTILDMYSFSRNKSLESIDIPDTVHTISGGAFLLCSSLHTVKLPKNLRDLPPGTFESCSSLKNITLPEQLESIGARAFAECTALEEITIPGKSLSDSSWELFAGATSLKKVVITEGCEIVANSAFAGCTSLTAIYFEGDAPTEFCQPEWFPDKECTVYYHEGAEGFTSPEWNGYPTKTW